MLGTLGLITFATNDMRQSGSVMRAPHIDGSAHTQLPLHGINLRPAPQHVRSQGSYRLSNDFKLAWRVCRCKMAATIFPSVFLKPTQDVGPEHYTRVVRTSNAVQSRNSMLGHNMVHIVQPVRSSYT